MLWMMFHAPAGYDLAEEELPQCSSGALIHHADEPGTFDQKVLACMRSDFRWDGSKCQGNRHDVTNPTCYRKLNAIELLALLL